LIAKESDYVVSVYNNSISVISFNPSIGDVFTVFYESNGYLNENTLIEPKINPYNMVWSVNSFIPTSITGNFIHEFYDLTNTGLTGNTVFSGVTTYSSNKVIFAEIFDWSNTTLIYGQTYFYRIKSEKYYRTINNISVSSETYSDIYQIKIPL